MTAGKLVDDLEKNARLCRAGCTGKGAGRKVEDTGINTVVAGGGVAANSLLRAKLAERQDLRCVFPPPELCGDNGAMVAGLGFRYFARGDRSPLNVSASARIKAFKRRYP